MLYFKHIFYCSIFLTTSIYCSEIVFHMHLNTMVFLHEKALKIAHLPMQTFPEKGEVANKFRELGMSHMECAHSCTTSVAMTCILMSFCPTPSSQRTESEELSESFITALGNFALYANQHSQRSTLYKNIAISIEKGEMAQEDVLRTINACNGSPCYITTSCNPFKIISKEKSDSHN